MRYFVHVKIKQDFITVDGDKITVGVRSTPEQGRANDEVVEKIAEYFGIPYDHVRIISGTTSRRKVVEVQ
ncbi:MAG: DUF167 domain-containing protein [Patescibacteria group bacterium]